MGWFLKKEGEQQSTLGMSLRDMDALHQKNILGLGEGLSNTLT